MDAERGVLAEMVMVETKRHGDAFDYFYSLGQGRSYKQVATKFKVSMTSVAKWSKNFNWKLRVTQRDIEINRKTEEKTNTQIVNTKADYRATIKDDLEMLSIIRQRFEALVADEKLAAAIKKGKIKIDSIEGLDRTASGLKKLHDLQKDYIRLDLQLIGEDVPDRSDLNIVLKLPENWNVDDVL